MYVLSPVPHCPDHCAFLRSLEVKETQPSYIVLLQSGVGHSRFCGFAYG